LVLHEGANLQDTCVMHGFPGTDSVIETNGHVGHGAVLHGCVIRENALVGMNAVIMDGAVIGESAIVAAMSFVKAAFEVPARHLVAGIPAKVMRELSEDEIAWKTTGTEDYQQLAIRSLQSMVETTPLSEPEPDRQRIQVACSVPLYQTKKK
jgi:phenylacetic acid degradation protein